MPSRQSEIDLLAGLVARRVARLADQASISKPSKTMQVSRDDLTAIVTDVIADASAPLAVFTPAAFGFLPDSPEWRERVATARPSSPAWMPTPMQVAANDHSLADAMRLVVKHQLRIAWSDDGACTVASRNGGAGRARFNLAAAVREAAAAEELQQARSKASKTS